MWAPRVADRFVPRAVRNHASTSVTHMLIVSKKEKGTSTLGNSEVKYQGNVSYKQIKRKLEEMISCHVKPQEYLSTGDVFGRKSTKRCMTTSAASTLLTALIKYHTSHRVVKSPNSPPETRIVGTSSAGLHYIRYKNIRCYIFNLYLMIKKIRFLTVQHFFGSIYPPTKITIHLNTTVIVGPSASNLPSRSYVVVSVLHCFVRGMSASRIDCSCLPLPTIPKIQILHETQPEPESNVGAMPTSYVSNSPWRFSLSWREEL
jgi:hypothetical protein